MVTSDVKRRLLFVSWDGGGRAATLRPLIRALLAQGHAVGLLSHAGMQKYFADIGLDFFRYQIAPSYSAQERKPLQQWMLDVFRDVWTSAELGEEASSVIAEFRPDVAVVDSLLATAQLSASASGVTFIRSRSALPANDPAALVVAKLAAQRIGPFAERCGIPRPASLEDVARLARWTLAFSFELLDRPQPGEQHVIHVGPLRDIPTVRDADEWRRRWPERPLVIVSLSTDFMGQDALLQTLCDSLAELPVEGLVTSGPAIDPVSVRAPANVTVLRYVSHDELLANAHLLVTHGGPGTVARALASGVPMLCIPLGRDQDGVASRICELGVGLVLPKESSSLTIGNALCALLTDDAIRQRSVAVSGKLAAHPGLEAAVEALLDAA
jgi:UDP:flavonoid glycosyltransferase YjiC (YdhE family)